jgi:hypothetical protein
MNRYDKIEFGQTSAEKESSDHPELIIKGFLDPNNAVPNLMSGSKFLVLGNKGSGKSAIAEKSNLNRMSEVKQSPACSIFQISHIQVLER